MENRTATPILALLVAALLACGEGSPTDIPSRSAEVPPPGDVAAAVAGVAVDVSGDWDWRQVERLRMPRWFVEGPLNALPQNDVVAEGPNTQATCTSEGELALTQTGASFHGSITRTHAQCETRGGQLFQGPGVGLPLQLFDGEIQGLNVAFSIGNLEVTPCPHHAVVSESSDGVALALSGGGRCVIPGHPLSGSVIPLDPPPGGTSTTLSFEAWRD